MSYLPGRVELLGLGIYQLFCSGKQSGETWDWVLHSSKLQSLQRRVFLLLPYMIFISTLEDGSDSGSAASQNCGPSCGDRVWSLEALAEFGGEVGFQAQAIRVAPFLSLGNGSFPEVRRRGAVPFGASSCWEMVVTREGHQGFFVLGSLGVRRGPFVCLLFLPNPTFHFHSKIVPQRHSFCVLRNLNCKTWTY